MNRTFFIADTHFGHGNIIKYCARNQFLNDSDAQELKRRGGTWHSGEWKGRGSSDWRISRETIDHMDDKLIENVNKMVGKDDTLYHLGDWCFAPKHEYYKAARAYRDKINCQQVYLIWGNHDSFQIRDLFRGCYDILNVNIGNQRITLCHYALAVWDRSHRGTWQLYGHSHCNLEEWIDKAMPGHLSMDVGVDNASRLMGDYRPFSFEEIAQIMTMRRGFFPDHHGNNRGIVSGPTEEEIAG